MRLHNRLIVNTLVMFSISNLSFSVANAQDIPTIACVDKVNNDILATQSNLYPHNVSKLKSTYSENIRVDKSIKQLETLTNMLQSLNEQLKSINDTKSYLRLLDVLDSLANVPISDFKSYTLSNVSKLIRKYSNNETDDSRLFYTLESDILNAKDLISLNQAKNSIPNIKDVVALKYLSILLFDKQREIDIVNSAKSSLNDDLGEYISNIKRLPSNSQRKQELIDNLPSKFVVRIITTEINKSNSSTSIKSKPESETATNVKLDTEDNLSSLLTIKINIAKATPTEETLKDVMEVYNRYEKIFTNSEQHEQFDKSINELKSTVDIKKAMDSVELSERTLTNDDYQKALTNVNALTDNSVKKSLTKRLSDLQNVVSINLNTFKEIQFQCDSIEKDLNKGKVNIDFTNVTTLLNTLQVKEYQTKAKKKIELLSDEHKTNEFLIKLAKTQCDEALKTRTSEDLQKARRYIEQLRNENVRFELLKSLTDVQQEVYIDNQLRNSSLQVNVIQENGVVSSTRNYNMMSLQSFECCVNALRDIYDLLNNRNGEFILNDEIVIVDDITNEYKKDLDVNSINSINSINSFTESIDSLYNSFRSNHETSLSSFIQLGKHKIINIHVKSKHGNVNNHRDIVNETVEMSRNSETYLSYNDYVSTLKTITPTSTNEIPFVELKVESPSVNFNSNSLFGYSPTGFNIGVNSNSSYDVSVKATNDFMSKSLTTVNVEKMLIGTADGLFKRLKKNESVNLISDTSRGYKVYPLMFKLDNVNNAKPGEYQTRLNLTAKVR